MCFESSGVTLIIQESYKKVWILTLIGIQTPYFKQASCFDAKRMTCIQTEVNFPSLSSQLYFDSHDSQVKEFSHKYRHCSFFVSFSFLFLEMCNITSKWMKYKNSLIVQVLSGKIRWLMKWLVVQQHFLFLLCIFLVICLLSGKHVRISNLASNQSFQIMVHMYSGRGEVMAQCPQCTTHTQGCWW